MLKNYEKIFEELDIPEPPEGLHEAILQTVAKRERRLFVIKFSATAAALGLSSFFAIQEFAAMGAELSHTGFLSFTSLLFSDFSMTIATFPDFAFSVAESFPFLSAAVAMLSMSIAIWSGAALVDEASVRRKQKFS